MKDRQQNVQKDKRWLQNFLQKTKDRATRTPLKTASKHGCIGRVASKMMRIISNSVFFYYCQKDTKWESQHIISIAFSDEDTNLRAISVGLAFPVKNEQMVDGDMCCSKDSRRYNYNMYIIIIEFACIYCSIIQILLTIVQQCCWFLFKAISYILYLSV